MVGRPGNRFFQDGWGDRDLIERYIALADRHPDDIDVHVRWSPATPWNGFAVHSGDYASPVEDLPPGVEWSSLEAVLPGGECRGLVVQMGAWNDNGFGGRRPLARRLASVGIGSVMMATPYFGARRPHGDGRHPIASVSDFFVMGRAAVLEARAVLTNLHRDGLAPFGRSGRVPVGVAGYSMGGNLGAFVSATVRFPVATSVAAAAHSPEPTFLGGLIRAGIDWDALADGGDPEQQLHDALSSISVLNFPPPPHAAAAVIVAGRGDGYIPTEAVEALHRHWKGSELRWTPEGHATLLWLRRPTLTRAVVDSFARLADSAA